MLYYYLTLQYRIYIRKSIEFGVHPTLLSLLIALIFIPLSFFILSKHSFGSYAYTLIAVSLLFKNKFNSQQFLRQHFNTKHLYSVNLLNKLMIVVPFIGILLIKFLWINALIILIIAVATSFLNLQKPNLPAIPIPFKKYIFESIIGFRQLWYAIGFCYFITVMAVQYNNENLGIFAFVIIGLLFISFYSKPEPVFYVWIYNKSVHKFFTHKLLWACITLTIIALPIVVTLCVFYTQIIGLMIGLSILVYVYLAFVIINKYAAYPLPISLIQGFVMAAAMAMPPLMLVFVPYYYKQAHKQVLSILKH